MRPGFDPGELHFVDFFGCGANASVADRRVSSRSSSLPTPLMPLDPPLSRKLFFGRFTFSLRRLRARVAADADQRRALDHSRDAKAVGVHECCRSARVRHRSCLLRKKGRASCLMLVVYPRASAGSTYFTFWIAHSPASVWTSARHDRRHWGGGWWTPSIE